MMPAALANALYDRTPYAPPKPYTAHPESNVVSIDFGRRTAALSDRFRSGTDAGSDAPEWLNTASDRLAHLRRLADGWDGVGSIGVSADTIAKAKRILELAFDGVAHPAPPATVPCGDGTIQLEWWLIDTRFELSIDADGRLESWGLDRESDHEASAVGTMAIELLMKWASRLTADKLSSAT